MQIPQFLDTIRCASARALSPGHGVARSTNHSSRGSAFSQFHVADVLEQFVALGQVGSFSCKFRHQIEGDVNYVDVLAPLIDYPLAGYIVDLTVASGWLS